MSLQECQAKHTSTEFLIWMQELDRLETTPTKDHHYYAQIAFQVVRPYLKNADGVNLLNFLLPFGEKKEEEVQPEVLSEEEREKRLADHKTSWLGAIGGGKLTPPKESNDG